jgi:hypothetical protein
LRHTITLSIFFYSKEIENLQQVAEDFFLIRAMSDGASSRKQAQSKASKSGRKSKSPSCFLVERAVFSEGVFAEKEGVLRHISTLTENKT